MTTTTMPTFVVVAHGVPAAQGSKRIVGGRLIEASHRVRPWRENVRHMAVTAAEEHGLTGPMQGPVSVEATFTFARPATHYRSGKNASVLRDAAPATPAKRPDVDKLLRAVLDAFTEAGVWIDDAQVVEVVGRKVFVGAGIDALAHPGALIRVWPMVATVGELGPVMSGG